MPESPSVDARTDAVVASSPVNAPSPPPAPPVTLSALFLGFARVGMSGFGGVLPWARREIVEVRRWLTEEQFTEALGLGQFLPGPNIVNVSVILGSRFKGPLGSIVAFSGLMLGPFLIAIGLAVLYGRYGHLPLVRHAFNGLTAAASGLILGTAGKLAKPLLRRPVAVCFGLATFAAIAFLRLPLLYVLLALAPFSVFASWPRSS